MSNNSTKRGNTEISALSCYRFGGLSLPLLLVGFAIALLLCFGVVPSYAYKLPDTGQTKCYNESGAEISCAGTGQDGEYSINLKSYTDNGNGTVTDNNAGLMWQKCSAGQNNDGSCSGTAITKTWDEAVAYCENHVHAGYSDWRLPSDMELMSIVDYSVPGPELTIKTNYFPNTQSSYYWSSTTDAYGTYGAWGVLFGDGYVSNGDYADPTTAMSGVCAPDSDWTFGDLKDKMRVEGCNTTAKGKMRVPCCMLKPVTRNPYCSAAGGM